MGAKSRKLYRVACSRTRGMTKEQASRLSVTCTDTTREGLTRYTVCYSPDINWLGAPRAKLYIQCSLAMLYQKINKATVNFTLKGRTRPLIHHKTMVELMACALTKGTASSDISQGFTTQVHRDVSFSDRSKIKLQWYVMCDNGKYYSLYYHIITFNPVTFHMQKKSWISYLKPDRCSFPLVFWRTTKRMRPVCTSQGACAGSKHAAQLKPTWYLKVHCKDYESFEYYVKIHNKTYSSHRVYLLHWWHI